jgi:drug/metabolite transporter (DMT)-like permease
MKKTPDILPPPMPAFSTLKAVGTLLLLGFIWGSGYSIARYATTHGVPPLGYSFWQSLGPTVFLILLGCKQKNVRASFKSAYLPFFFLCGLLGIAIPNSNMYYTAAHLPAGMLAVLVNTVPLFVYPIACVFKQESFSIERIAGVFIGFFGLLYLIFPFHSLTQLSEIPPLTPWAWLTLVSPLCFALCAVYISHARPSSVGIYAASIGMLATSTIFLAPFVWFHHDFYSLLPPFDLPKYAVILEIILSSIGYLLFFYLIKYAGSVYYSLTGSVVSLTGIFWGNLFFGETVGETQIIAILIIISAILIVSYSYSPHYLHIKKRIKNARHTRRNI